MFSRGMPSLTSRPRQASAAAPAPEVTSLTSLDVLAADLQRVQDAGADDDRGAVLVVVEDRDLHPRAQRALDVEAVRRLDVLEVDAAEGRLERGDQVDQLVEVLLVDLDVEDVDAGELLEQDALAFHHRLGGERADVAEAEHRGAVGDHGDQVAARGVAEGVRRIGDDLLACRGDAGRVGEREVVLVDELLGRGDRDLARRRELVVVERGAAQLGGFLFGVRHAWRVGSVEVGGAGRAAIIAELARRGRPGCSRRGAGMPRPTARR